MSQEEVKLAVPVGLNWNEHSAGSAITTTGDFSSAASRVGFTRPVSAWKRGK